MKKTCFEGERCPVLRGYDAIGDWWSLLIMTQILFFETKRFSELQEALGMAKNILSARLSKLVDKGILDKVPASDGSSYMEYAATEKGRDLYILLIALRQWGEKHLFDSEKAMNVLVDKRTEKRVPPLEVRSSVGKVLGLHDLDVVPVKTRRR